MKKIHVIKESGQFGPGTKTNITLGDPSWKAQAGAIENKRRPEAVYILMSTWLAPQLSVINARKFDETEVNIISAEIAKEFRDTIRRNISIIRSFFNSQYFDQSTFIFKIDYSPDRAEAGKYQFLELDINIETINSIDDNGNPIPTIKGGKINQLHFNEFVKHLTDAANKITQMDIFKNSSLMTFRKTK